MMENTSKEKKSTGEASPEQEIMPQVETAGPLISSTSQTFLQLQRQYGNAGVQRLLNNPIALQQAAPRLAVKLQRQERPIRVPYRLQHQNVGINTVGTPQILPNGGFEWLVDFLLPTPAPGDGYIIQECRHNAVDLMTGAPLRSEWHYWEAWRVRAGSREPVDRGGGNCHDQYRYSILIPEESPWIESSIRGIARFYETPDFPWGNDHPRNNPSHNFFHDLPAPPIWTGEGTAHEAVCNYDTRSGTPSTRLIMTHGAQQTVLRDPPTSRP